MSFIYYKFKSNIEYDTVKFDGLHISLEELREQILTQKKMTKSTGFTLQIVNSQTKEEYKDKMLIPKNTSVIITRVPLTVQQQKKLEKLSAPRIVLSSTNNSLNAENVLKKPLNTAAFIKDFYAISQSSNLEKLDVTNEQDRIKAMMQQATQDFDPNTYHNLKFRMAPPAGYICYRCHIPGHWIQYCPNSEHSSNIGVENRIKRSTGIPKSFMTAVVGPEVKGALLTNDGQFAVPWIEQQAYSQKKIEPIPFLPPQSGVVDTSVSHSFVVQDHLITSDKTQNDLPKPDKSFACIICGLAVMINPTIVPCCGQNYCLTCISKALLENEDRVCPACHESEVNVKSLIPNPKLAHAIEAYNQKLLARTKKDLLKKDTLESQELGFLSPQKPKKVPLLPAPIGNVSQSTQTWPQNMVLPNIYPIAPPNIISYPPNLVPPQPPTSLLMPVISSLPYESQLTTFQKPVYYEKNDLNEQHFTCSNTNISKNVIPSNVVSNGNASSNVLQTSQNLVEHFETQILDTQQTKLDMSTHDNSLAQNRDFKHYNERSSEQPDPKQRKSLTPTSNDSYLDKRRSSSRRSVNSYSSRSRSPSVYRGDKNRKRKRTEKGDNISDRRRKDYTSPQRISRESRSKSHTPFQSRSRSPSLSHRQHKNTTYASGYRHRRQYSTKSPMRRYSPPSSREPSRVTSKSPPSLYSDDDKKHHVRNHETVDRRRHYDKRSPPRKNYYAHRIRSSRTPPDGYMHDTYKSSDKLLPSNKGERGNKYYSEAFYHNVLAPALALAEAKKRAKLRANVFADEFNRTSSYDLHHSSRDHRNARTDPFSLPEESNKDYAPYAKNYQSYYDSEYRRFPTTDQNFENVGGKYSRYHDTLEERAIYLAGKTSTHQPQESFHDKPKKKGPLLPIPTDERVRVDFKSDSPPVINSSSFDDKELVNRRDKSDEKTTENQRSIKKEANENNENRTSHEDSDKMNVSLEQEPPLINNKDEILSPKSPSRDQEVSNQSQKSIIHSETGEEQLETRNQDYQKSDLRILDEYTRDEKTASTLLNKCDPDVYVEEGSASIPKTDRFKVTKTQSPKVDYHQKQPRQKLSPIATNSSGSKMISLVKKVESKSHEIKTPAKETSYDKGKTVVSISSQDPKRYRDLAKSSLKRTETAVVSSVKASAPIFGTRSVVLNTDTNNFNNKRNISISSPSLSFGGQYPKIAAGLLKNPPKIKVILHKNQRLQEPLKSEYREAPPMPNTPPKQLSSSIVMNVKPSFKNSKKLKSNNSTTAKNIDQISENDKVDHQKQLPINLQEPINNCSDSVTLQDPQVTASDNVNYNDDTFDIHVKDDYGDLNFEESNSNLGSNQTNSLSTTTQTSISISKKKDKNLIKNEENVKSRHQKNVKKHKKKHKKDKSKSRKESRTRHSGSRKHGHKHKSKKEKKRAKSKRNARSSS